MTISGTDKTDATFRFTDVLDHDLIELFSELGPYYTSYPTLSEWTPTCGREEFARAIAAPGGDPSPTILYVHFPFCPRLCHYCICNATISTDRERIRSYLKSLHRNLDLLFASLDRGLLIDTIKSIHIGGGSPSFMEPQEFLTVADKIRSLVGRGRIEEFAVEVDPRTASPEKFDAFHQAGVNRLSFGVQDLNEEVQHAINRVHSFEEIQALLTPELRNRFPSINFDILYGLPLQTRESFRRTIEQVIQLSPDRVALLKYAPRSGTAEASKAPGEVRPSPGMRPGVAVLRDAGGPDRSRMGAHRDRQLRQASGRTGQGEGQRHAGQDVQRLRPGPKEQHPRRRPDLHVPAREPLLPERVLARRVHAGHRPGPAPGPEGLPSHAGGSSPPGCDCVHSLLGLGVVRSRRRIPRHRLSRAFPQGVECPGMSRPSRARGAAGRRPVRDGAWQGISAESVQGVRRVSCRQQGLPDLRPVMGER